MVNNKWLRRKVFEFREKNSEENLTQIMENTSGEKTWILEDYSNFPTIQINRMGWICLVGQA